jgi:hypothetical protein
MILSLVGVCSNDLEIYLTSCLYAFIIVASQLENG